MPDQALLRELARAVIRDGHVPSTRHYHFLSGQGLRAACSVCDSPVTEDEAHVRIQVVEDGDCAGLYEFQIHITYGDRSDAERRDLAGAVPQPLSAVDQTRRGCSVVEDAQRRLADARALIASSRKMIERTRAILALYRVREIEAGRLRGRLRRGDGPDAAVAQLRPEMLAAPIG